MVCGELFVAICISGLACVTQKGDGGYKMLAVITAGYNSQRWTQRAYRVTAHLTFPDPKPENHGNYRGNRGNYPVIRNQGSCSGVIMSHLFKAPDDTVLLVVCCLD